MYLNKQYLEDIELPIIDPAPSRETSMIEPDFSRREIMLETLKDRDQADICDFDIQHAEEDIKNIVHARKDNFLKYYYTFNKDRLKDTHQGVDKRKASLTSTSGLISERPSMVFSPPHTNNAHKITRQQANFKRKSFQDKQKTEDPSLVDDFQKETRQLLSKKEIEIQKLNLQEIEERYKDILSHAVSGMNMDQETTSNVTLYYKDGKAKDWVSQKVDFPSEKNLKDLKIYLLSLINKNPPSAFKFKGALLDDDDSSISSSDLIDEDENKKVKALDSGM